MRMIFALMGAGLAAACAAGPATPPAPGGGLQRCNAADASSLIGSHFGAVTFPQGKKVRFVCTTCAATMDHDPDRLNVRFEEATGIIRSVDCG